ncbi:hypothetical protein ACH4UR_37205 [Streptomyces lydicus]|uniref:hypothetical protein n=1 Tax=Streptomyces lydicus TaxID=47763 RepID=UPI0033F4C035
MSTKPTMLALRVAELIRSAHTAITSRIRRTHPSIGPRSRAKFHRGTRFWPVEHDGFDEDTLPALEMAGALVFVYLDPDSSELNVSVHLETVDRRLLGRKKLGEAVVPLHVTVQGNTVFRA